MKIYTASPLRAESEGMRRIHMLACTNYKKIVAEDGHIGTAVHDEVPKIYDDTDPIQRRAGMLLGQNALRGSDVLYCCGKDLSTGMKEEVELALALKKPVVCFSKAMDDILTQEGLQHMFFYDAELGATPVMAVIHRIRKRGWASDEEKEVLRMAEPDVESMNGGLSAKAIFSYYIEGGPEKKELAADEII